MTDLDDGAVCCWTCSRFREIPRRLSDRHEAWGYCAECDEYVCGETRAEDCACEGDGYERGL